VDRLGQVNIGIGADALLDLDSDSFRLQMTREAREAEKSMNLHRRPVHRIGGRPQLWTTIMIRADREVEYEQIQRMMRICQELGFHKFALRASPEGRHM
jgi:biopolymer transport protein ExbD